MTPANRESRVQVSSKRVEAIVERVAACPDPAFLTSRESVLWRDWSSDVRQLRDENRFLAGCALGLVFRPTSASYAVLAALACLDCHVHLLDEGLGPDRVLSTSRDFGLAGVLDPGGGGPERGLALRMLLESPLRNSRGEVTIFTSGSTGAPKAVHHDWETLTRPVRQGCQQGAQTWLLTYRPHLYAGLQVFLHCLLNRGALVIPESSMSVEAVIRLMSRHRVSHVSATPSYWRRLVTLGGADLRALGIKQITLGGEPCDQPLLDALHDLFPGARLVHIYATSELGRCFSVRDGRAGFPAAYLSCQTEEGVALRIEDGELLVRSENAMLDIAGGEAEPRPDAQWVPTGDLVEQVGDRCYFVGRRSDLINVGGNKVHPHRVEAVVQTVSGVTDTRVYARRSSLVGQMIACEFVIATGLDPEQVKQQIIEECRERLAPHERPRFLDPVPAIELSEAGKKVRRPG
jgi:acyl-CoA synthetase (AMP-forming)/AMP-acid ligase II